MILLNTLLQLSLTLEAVSPISDIYSTLLTTGGSHTSVDLTCCERDSIYVRYKKSFSLSIVAKVLGGSLASLPRNLVDNETISRLINTFPPPKRL